MNTIPTGGQIFKIRSVNTHLSLFSNFWRFFLMSVYKHTTRTVDFTQENNFLVSVLGLRYQCKYIRIIKQV